jgi:hypothetical protein
VLNVYRHGFSIAPPLQIGNGDTLLLSLASIPLRKCDRSALSYFGMPQAVNRASGLPDVEK